MSKPKPKNKLIWRVDPPPTGQYRSFQKRHWPTGFINGSVVFQVACEDEYIPRYVDTGNHAELSLLIADRRESSRFKWCRFKKRFTNLGELKATAQKFLDKRPEFLTHLRDE